MEFLIFLIITLLVIFYLFRPTSKKELKKFEDNDNWSNMILKIYLSPKYITNPRLHQTISKISCLS